MKKIFILLPMLILFGNITHAQSTKELKKHHKLLKKSKKENSKILSLDTLFISGLPYCIMKPFLYKEKENKRKEDLSKIQKLGLKIVPSYDVYSLTGRGPIIMELYGIDENSHYEISFEYNNWSRSSKLELTQLGLKEKIINLIAESYLFGKNGNKFNPNLLVANTANSLPPSDQVAYSVGVRNSKQDTSFVIRMNTDKGEITRGTAIISTYKIQKDKKEKQYCALFYPTAKHHPFVVFPMLKTSGKVKFITEIDNKEHEIDIPKTSRQIRTIASYLGNLGYL